MQIKYSKNKIFNISFLPYFNNDNCRDIIQSHVEALSHISLLILINLCLPAQKICSIGQNKMSTKICISSAYLINQSDSY